MKTTSHFVGIELQAQVFSDTFVQVYKYLQQHNIEEILEFQNPLSMHITLYYFEKDLSHIEKENIKKDIANLDMQADISLSGFTYFSRNSSKYIGFFEVQTDLPLKSYRDHFHTKYNRDFVKDNTFDFSPHITFFKIRNANIYEQHRDAIESIIFQEIVKYTNQNIQTGSIYLFAVNSDFKEQIQITL